MFKSKKGGLLNKNSLMTLLEIGQDWIKCYLLFKLILIIKPIFDFVNNNSCEINKIKKFPTIHWNHPLSISFCDLTKF